MRAFTVTVELADCRALGPPGTKAAFAFFAFGAGGASRVDIFGVLAVVGAGKIAQYIQIDFFRLVGVVANELLALAEHIGDALLELLEVSFGDEVPHDLDGHFGGEDVDSAAAHNLFEGLLY